MINAAALESVGIIVGAVVTGLVLGLGVLVDSVCPLTDEAMEHRVKRRNAMVLVLAIMISGRGV